MADRRTRSRSSSLCLALLVVNASAQNPSQALDEMLLERVEQQLASVEAGDVAWGGYLAQRYRLRQAAGPLLEALGQWRARDSLEARVVRLHLVDGLVGVRAKVAAEQVEFLLADPLTRDAAFALLVGNPKTNRDAIVRAAMAPAEELDSVRAVAAQVIVDFDLRSREYVQFLLSHLKCELKLDVVDARTEHGGWNSKVGLGGRRTPELVRLRGFPPLARLELGSRRDAQESMRMILPANGGSPVVISRTEGVNYTKDELCRGEIVESPGATVVASTLERMAGSALVAQAYLQHDYVDGVTFTQFALAARTARVELLDAFVAKLRERGWLRPADLPGYRIALEVNISDRRGDKAVALPELPPIPPPAGR